MTRDTNKRRKWSFLFSKKRKETDICKEIDNRKENTKNVHAEQCGMSTTSNNSIPNIMSLGSEESNMTSNTMSVMTESPSMVPITKRSMHILPTASIFPDIFSKDEANDDDKARSFSVYRLFSAAKKNNKSQSYPPRNIYTTTKTSMFTKTKTFRKLTEWAFNLVDTDKSGCVDKKELYSGLLLIHLKLATYAGPAACKPMTLEMVEDVFDKMDIDNSGSLNHEEFQQVMMVLCSQILSRVFMQWSLTLLIVPVIAQCLFDLGYYLIGYTQHFISEIEVLVEIKSSLHLMILKLFDILTSLWDRHFPMLVKNTVGHIRYALNMIPDDILETIPVTLISIILGCLVVPYTILRIDGFFTSLADKKSKKSIKDCNNQVSGAK